jgi:hypothetical protein
MEYAMVTPTVRVATRQFEAIMRLIWFEGHVDLRLIWRWN